MLKRLSIFLFSLIALHLSNSDSGADFYKYIDDEGVIHITNVPVSPKYKWMMSERKSYKPSRVTKTVYNKKFDNIIEDASARHGVDPVLVKAIVKAESDFDSGAVSTAGARGLMQLMPDTARRMGVNDVHNPEENVEGGIRYLSKLLKMFDWKVPLAVAAYNAGENAVLKYGKVPPYEETQTYVKRVLHYYDTYRRK